MSWYRSSWKQDSVSAHCTTRKSNVRANSVHLVKNKKKYRSAGSNAELFHRRARTCDCIYYIDNGYKKTASNLPSDVLRQSIGPEIEYRHSVEINCFHMCKFFADIHTHSIVQHRVCRRAHDTRFLQTTTMRCCELRVVML